RPSRRRTLAGPRRVRSACLRVAAAARLGVPAGGSPASGAGGIYCARLGGAVRLSGLLRTGGSIDIGWCGVDHRRLRARGPEPAAGGAGGADGVTPALAWLVLVIGGLFEVGFTTCLRFVDGFR